MKNKDIFKQLFPGVIVGMILGFGIGMLAGVNPTDPIPNYIGWILACIIPTVLNGIIVLMGTAKVLDRKLSIGQALKRLVPFILTAAVIGLIVVTLIIEQLMGINTCELTRVVNAIGQAITGVIVSTVLGYFAIKNYESAVKYTRRK